MSTLGDLAGELVGRFPGLSPFLAETFITRAWQSVASTREWSWLVNDGVVNCPAQVATGTAAITQYSATVTMSAAASAALAAITAPALTALQIRFMGTSQTSQIYNILAVNTANPNAYVLTLDRVVQEATNALSAYLVYRVYITPPIADFVRWESLDDFTNGIRIVKSSLGYSSAYFDVRDPQRQAFGFGYYVGFYKAASTTNSAPVYELWPGCTNGQQWYVRYRRRGTAYALTDTLPSQLNDGWALARAMVDSVYPHIQANIGHFPGMAKANWVALYQEQRANAEEFKRLATIDDDNQATSSVINRGHGLKTGRWGTGEFPYPIDSAFFQSHPIFW